MLIIKLNYLLINVDFTESYTNDQQNEIQSAYFGNQSFSLFTSCCYFKDAANWIRNESVVVVTKNSDRNRITPMSCLKKVIGTVDTEWGKSFTNVVEWWYGCSVSIQIYFSTSSRSNVLE